MERQLFVVTLEVPPAVSHCFPRVEAERMANIIRDAVQAKSCSFMGPVPFKLTVERVDEAASASGEMREYTPEEFDELPEESAVNSPLEPEASRVEAK
ncbi:MAG: hypothetical protein COW22_01855 [Chloroflexi bacterium CG15_BIG_FIL_POST_REV_8_21_14_020_46_15]|nr:MAG: hypothetical protein AUK39_02360 [Dehalococcoidia bacterium CG2_30_46_19]PIW40419.1 MAG: hypothetical protein COW22_01855 [Chloroflexi bacterium CG15_BIG_FIL_POST_REV_8_21_14_020_46_15]